MTASHPAGDRSERPESTAAGIALAVGAAATFGTLAIFAKLGYRQGADPLPLLAGRFAIASALLVLWQAGTRRPLLHNPRLAVRLTLLGGLYGLEASLFFLALDNASAAVVSLIFYSYPMWTNLIGLATGIERWHTPVAAALGLSTIGVASIFTVEDIGLAGPLLALAAAVSVAVYFILAQLILRDADTYETTTWTTIGAAVVTCVAAVIGGGALPSAALPHAAALAFASAISFLLVYAAIARIGSARTAVANTMEPVTTVVLAAMVLGEAITLRMGIGALLVVGALPILASAGPRPVHEPPA
ncbi:MAG: DMT family transporter [Actinomycetota bacterium]